MSTSAVCPHCSAVSSFHRVPVTSCPRCNEIFPDALRGQIEASLLRSKAPQPVLLTIGMYGSLLFGGVAILFLALAPFDIGSYSIGDEVVSGPEFLRRAGIAFAAVSGLCLGIGYGLWKERTWARPLMVAYWAIVSAASITAGPNASMAWALLTTGFFAVITMGLAAWYLYGNSAVVAYYEALQSAEQAALRVVPATTEGRGA